MDRINRAINQMDSTSFEKFGYAFIDIITGMELKHRGTNLNNQPVGYTVDAYSDNGDIVAEFSVEKSYFDTSYSKALNDINHAISYHPNVKTVYLIIGIEAKPSQGTGFANFIAEQEKKHNISIFWFDSRQIAEYIYNNLASCPLRFKNIKKHIPVLDEIYKLEFAYLDSLKTPENYYFNCSDSIDILKNKKCIYISGISGIGKTALSYKLKDSLDKAGLITNVYFINLSEVDEVSKLSSLQVNNQSNVNVIPLLKSTEKSLFIFDNLSSNEYEITEIICKSLCSESYLIITSQIESLYAKSNDFLFSCKFPLPEDAKKILNHKIKNDNKCPEKVFKIISDKTNNHPLLLQLFRRMIFSDEYTWDDIVDIVSDTPNIEADNHRLLFELILNKHKETIKKELRIIQWLNTNIISEPLLKKLIKNYGIQKMKKRALVISSNDLVRIHDLIFDSIKNIQIESSSYDSIEPLFISYFIDRINNRDHEFYSALHIHKVKIKECFENNPTNYKIGYLYLLAFPDDDFDITKDIDIFSSSIDLSDDIDISFYCELIELHFKRDKKRLTDETKFPELSPKYTSLIDRLIKETGTLSRASKESMLHHKGKILLYTKQYSDAIKVFESVINNNSEAYKSMLQLIRAYKNSKTNKQEMYSLIETIINAYKSSKTINLSIVLEVYSLISQLKENEIKEKYLLKDFDTVKGVITSSSTDSYDQPYRVLSQISNYYSYTHSEKLIEIFLGLSVISASAVQKNNYFIVAQLYKEVGKAYNYIENSESAKTNFELAESFYELCQNLSNEYHVTQRAENYELLNKHADAIDYLNDNPFPDGYFWQYRISLAYLNLSDNRALDHINKALQIAETDSKFNKYLGSAFYIKARILIKLNIVQYKEQIIECYKKAIESSDTEKFKLQLIKELEDFIDE